MKKTAAVVFSMLAVLVLAVTALAGCRGSSETQDSLAGTSWKVVQIKQNRVEMSEADYLKMIGAESGEMVMIFSEDHVQSKIGDQTQQMSGYTYEDGKLVIINVAEGTVEGNKMTLTDEYGITMVLQKK